MSYPWPQLEAIRDLVNARLLPVRQSVGQFLSGFQPNQLVSGWQEIRMYHRARYAPAARVLLVWLKSRLEDCGAASDLEGVVQPCEAAGSEDFAVEFRYDNNHYFKWRADIGKNHAEFVADLGGGRCG